MYKHIINICTITAYYQFNLYYYHLLSAGENENPPHSGRIARYADVWGRIAPIHIFFFLLVIK